MPQAQRADSARGDEKSSPMAWSPLKLISPVAKRYMAMLHAARENSITGSQKNIQEPIPEGGASGWKLNFSENFCCGDSDLKWI